MPDEDIEIQSPDKIGVNTPLELTPDGFVRPLFRGVIIPHSIVFTVQELLVGMRITARGSWRSCTLQMKGMWIEETRHIGNEQSRDFNVESRNCGTVTDWLAEHDLFLDENASATKA